MKCCARDSLPVMVQTGPLRGTDVGPVAGTLGAAGLVTILSICLTIYGIASFKEGAPSTASALTLTGRVKEADKLQVSSCILNLHFQFSLLL